MSIKTYTFSGTVESWTVPPSFGAATVHVQLWGASGGSDDRETPAAGGYVEGDLAVVVGDVLYFRVGGTPGTFDDLGPSHYATAGYNGGGAGNAAKFSGGGGGASDIRKNGTGLANRVAVAAGAGGDSNDDHGGHGGASTGGNAGDATFGGKGGSQSAGGAAGSGGSGPGTLGVGGNGSLGAGGGGGYYGGGGGSQGTHPAAGGGGSNYTGGLTGTITSTAGANSADVTNGKIVLTFDLTPNAPLLTYPLSNFAYDQSQDFTVVFSDDDPGDTISAIEVRYRVGAGAWTTTGKLATTTPKHTYASGTFAAMSGTPIEWQARTWDSSDAVSAWSASAFATPYPTPASFVFSPAPTLLVPNPVIAGVRSDAGQIAAYQIRVTDDVAGAPGPTIVADTGVITVSATSISQALPDATYVNGQKYHVLVKIAYPTGVWNASWTDSGALTANIAGPLAPTFAQYAIDEWAAVQLDITNPDSDPNPPDHNDIYRTEVATGVETKIATEVDLNSTYFDEGSGLNRPYTYRVEAVTANGARTSS